LQAGARPVSRSLAVEGIANAGHDTRALQAWLGHKNIQHTVRYTELAPDRFRDFWRGRCRQCGHAWPPGDENVGPTVVIAASSAILPSYARRSQSKSLELHGVLLVLRTIGHGW